LTYSTWRSTVGRAPDQHACRAPAFGAALTTPLHNLLAMRGHLRLLRCYAGFMVVAVGVGRGARSSAYLSSDAFARCRF